MNFEVIFFKITIKGSKKLFWTDLLNFFEVNILLEMTSKVGQNLKIFPSHYQFCSNDADTCVPQTNTLLSTF